MALIVFDKFWHGTLKRPYHLARSIDIPGPGDAVLLLHGIGRSGQVWEHVVYGLAARGLRIVGLDLLGFGASPKPEWPAYSVDDHAAAVIATIEKLKLKRPLVIVGHSMGCLVAVRVARRRPDLVKHLVLFEMPLYEGLPHKRSYRLRTDLYFRFYRRVTRFQPTFNEENARLAERLAHRIVGLEVTRETWLPFIRSLENTIMKQTAADDIKQLPMPMDVIYGRFDMFVIRGQPQRMFGVDTENIAAHTVRARHVISLKASQFLVERILAAHKSRAL
jgi:pimeloyl-ACP methyl ester carboxylesterase